MKVKRIVEALERAESEHRIAEAEQVPPRIVRRVCQLELRRRSQQVRSIGVAIGTMLDDVTHLHREFDESVFEELLEGAA